MAVNAPDTTRKRKYFQITALGREDLAEYARVPPGPGQAPLVQFFTETFASQPLAHWEAFLADVDVCWSPVRDLHSAIHEPHLKARGMLLNDAEGNEHLGVPIKFTAEPAQPDFGLPGLGADNTAVMNEAGFDAEQIAALKASGSLMGE